MAGKSFEEWLDLIEEMHKDVIEIKTVLKGYDGQNGLVKQVSNNRRALTKIWLILAFVGGGSGVTVGIVKLVELLGV